MAGKRDESESAITPPSDFAERHRPIGRTSAKHRRPTNSGVTPPLPVRQRRRGTGQGGEQQNLPFRGQGSSGVVTVRRRTLGRIIPDTFGPRLFKVGLALFFLVLLFGGLILGLYMFGGSRFFALRDIELQGNKRVSHAEVLKIVRDNTPDGVWRVQIKQLRERLKQHDLIEDAEVTRVLPDTIYVTLKEREPYTLARSQDRVVCVDRNGVMFGNESLLKGQNIPPLVSGLVTSGDNIQEANRQRMMLYQQLIKELDNAEPQLSPRIDEVIFDDEMNVRLILKDSRVAVLVGQEDFRTRLNAALDVLDAVRRKDAESLQVLKIEDAQKLLDGRGIAYINATIPKRVIVGLAE